MSFYVRIRKSGWYLYEEKYVDGERLQLKVPNQIYLEIGIDPDLSPEAAKQRVKEINKERSFQRKQQHAAAARTALKLQDFDKLYFKEEDIVKFEERLRMRTAGSDRHLQKLFSQFKHVQKMMRRLKIGPEDYLDKSEYIFKYLAENEISLDYSNKIIQMANYWGAYLSKRQAKFFDPISPIPGSFQTLIAKAQRKKKKAVRRPSKRLNIPGLAKLKTKLSREKYNWVALSFEFGLRPDEVDSLKESAEVITNISGVEVLRVFQSKIEGADLEGAYKYIPILFEEQRVALSALPEIARPSAKEIGAVLEGCDTYCGRKGFADLMQSRGQKLEHISLWLGHKNIQTTLKTYKDLANVPFTPVKKIV
jgi:hypothetical protein